MLEQIERIEILPDRLGVRPGSLSTIYPARSTHERFYAERIIGILLAEHDIKGASTLLRLTLPPDCIQARKLSALISAESGDIEQAITELTEIADDETVCGAERFFALAHLEKIYAEASRYDEANVCLRKRAALMRDMGLGEGSGS